MEHIAKLLLLLLILPLLALPILSSSQTRRGKDKVIFEIDYFLCLLISMFLSCRLAWKTIANFLFLNHRKEMLSSDSVCLLIYWWTIVFKNLPHSREYRKHFYVKETHVFKSLLDKFSPGQSMLSSVLKPVNCHWNKIERHKIRLKHDITCTFVFCSISKTLTFCQKQ